VSRFQIQTTALPGLTVVTHSKLGDTRGFLSRLFCARELAAAGWHKPVAQINHTFTARTGTLRGMHYQQVPHAEMKLVQCLQGEIWDVAVDLRPASPTYLQSHGEKLSADNARALLIPEGFAHGFQTLSPDCELLYVHSAAHHAGAEAGLRFDDPALAIAWPLPVTEISERDQQHPLLSPTFSGVVLP
jgi:dTDP-4-dehydrorhamnose 3,5-epimerase